MPICRKCGNYFSSRITVDGKQRNITKRKYCLICSPFGMHNTRKIELPRLSKNRKEMKICKICNREVLIIRGGTACSTCKNKEKRESNKLRAWKVLGDKCIVCGYCRCRKALNVHHLNSDEKEFGLAANWHLSWQRIEKEIQKCVVICNRCHVELHDGLISLEGYLPVGAPGGSRTRKP